MSDTEKVRSRFPWSAPLSDPAPQIAALTVEQVLHLRLPWMSRFNTESLTGHVRANPDMSLWVPSTGEYVITEQWRRRQDITHIVEVHARRGKQALIEAVLAKARSLDQGLTLISDEVWKDSPRLYSDLHFDGIERIVFFQKDLRGLRVGDMVSGSHELEITPCGWAELELLLTLDHDSFPWLWWNSRAEFEEYRRMPGVHITIARLNAVPIGYASFTMYGSWAHLDRLAVITPYQGRKLGAAQLTHTLQAMRDMGAASVGLSTQQSNTTSHSLYKSFGFRQTREQMNFYGVSLA